MSDNHDAGLINRALERTEGIGGLRKRAEAIGISDGTLRIWLAARRDGKPFPPLSEKVRRRLSNARVLDGAGRGALEEAGTDDDFWRRYDAIEESELNETLKILKLEALAAAVRARNARYEARAAEIRARAIVRAEDSAVSRAKAIEQAEATAARRAALLSKGGEREVFLPGEPLPRGEEEREKGVA